MPTKFSLRGLVKSRMSKKEGKSEAQNGRHSLGSPTIPPVVWETEAASSSVTEQQAPSNPPLTIVAQGTPTDSGAEAIKTRLSASTSQDTSSAPSSHVVQTQVPLSVVPITSAQARLARADPRAIEPQPAGEFAVQQTQAISTSQRLWNDAYDSLENDDETAELVKAYVKTLAIVLEAEKASDISVSVTSDVSSELKDPSKREMYMKKLIKDG